jgi:Xaa-Pro aminopeptidase
LGVALPSLGTIGVDFEERVNYRRLHRYRLGRAQLALHERPIISRVVSLEHPTEIKEGMVFAIETYCPATDGYSGARGHGQGLQGDLAVPGRGTADCESVLRRTESDQS